MTHRNTNICNYSTGCAENKNLVKNTIFWTPCSFIWLKQGIGL